MLLLVFIPTCNISRPFSENMFLFIMAVVLCYSPDQTSWLNGIQADAIAVFKTVCFRVFLSIFGLFH